MLSAKVGDTVPLRFIFDDMFGFLLGLIAYGFFAQFFQHIQKDGEERSLVVRLFSCKPVTIFLAGSAGYRKLLACCHVELYIYRRKKYVGEATWAPRGWRARPGGKRAPLPRALLVAFLT